MGWYLMVPPYDLSKALVDDAAPLSKWTIEDSFGSVDECRERIIADYSRAKAAERGFEEYDRKQRELAKKGDRTAQQWVRDDANTPPPKNLSYTGTLAPRDPDVVPGICISTDDPRLKEK